MPGSLSRRSLFTGLGGGLVAAVAVAANPPAVSAPSAAGDARVRLVSPPFRIEDTRLAPAVKLATGSTLGVFVPGLIGQGVVGVVVNVTITETEGSGFLRVRADNAPAGNATSNINWSTTGQTLANLVMVPAVGTRGVAVQAGGAGRTHVVIDLVGYLTQP